VEFLMALFRPAWINAFSTTLRDPEPNSCINNGASISLSGSVPCRLRLRQQQFFRSTTKPSTDLLHRRLYLRVKCGNMVFLQTAYKINADKSPSEYYSRNVDHDGASVSRPM